MKIIIKEKFKNDFTTRDAGENLRNIILNSNEKVTLDFLDLKIASASFFDEGIGKLSSHGWTQDDYNTKLEIINIFSKDYLLLKKILSMRGITIPIQV